MVNKDIVIEELEEIKTQLIRSSEYYDACGSAESSMQASRELIGFLKAIEIIKKHSEIKTNGDNIRSMKDEELADWVVKHDKKALEKGYWTRERILQHMRNKVNND